MIHDTWRAHFARPSDIEFRELLERLPAAAYTTDSDGLITWFNGDAVEVWGREPLLNDPVDRFCGSFRLFYVDGRPMTHADCWMGRALRDREPYNGQEVAAPSPLLRATGSYEVGDGDDHEDDRENHARVQEEREVRRLGAF